LLGARPGSPYFRHNARNPLDADIVVIDEASMVDLALMAKLADALKPDARLILLGDKNQLASVEAGSVLGDLCAGCAEFSRSPDALMEIRRLTGFSLPQETGKPSSQLADCVIELKKNYRTQASAAALPMLSEAVNRGDADGAIAILESNAGAGIAWRRLPATDRIEAELHQAVIDGFAPVVTARTPESALERFGDFRILCALRQGPWGVENINRIAERILTHANLLVIDGQWYHGRPILITANDYNLGLFNGDTGICMRDPAHGNRIRAFFPSADGLRAVLPQRLPPHETVFAMTVHKSQGSEFERTILVLPDRVNPLLTRELVYTGITRARSHAEIWTSREIFAQAVAAKIARTSGLRKALWGLD
jgi:exodeoxyribonuclease V alpha subunit